MYHRFLLNISLLLLTFLSPQAIFAQATTIGYSKDAVSKNNTFRIGSYAKQGQAIRIPKAKLQILKGKTISSVDFVVGTKNTTGNAIHAFITSSLSATPISESDVLLSKPLSKTRWTLNLPYVITGNETDLYIGYTTEAKSARPLVADGSFDISGYNYALCDTAWIDTYATSRGSACIYVNINENVYYADIIVGRYDFSGYYKTNNNNIFTISMVNAGTQAVNSFDAVYSISGTKKQRHYSGLDIKPKDGYSINIDDIDISEEGAKELQLMITNVNGGNNDIDLTDNNANASIYFYPTNMERSVLVESFTGQGCAGCPNGHKNILKAIDVCEKKTSDEIVEISHHAGYYVDIFTMTEDNELRFYYPEPEHTFAPGVMANRLTFATINSKAPVMDTVDSDIIVQLLDSASASHPMASLNIESEFDKVSRLLNVKFQIMPHEPLPETAVYNVCLVQDSISAYQNNGGNRYKHNRVFRGMLNYDSFGIPVKGLQPGEITTWQTSTFLPQKIHSSLFTSDMLTETTDSKGNKKQVYVYTSPNSSASTMVDAEECDIDAIADNMTIVAYLAECDKADKYKNTIFNCIETPVGYSHCHAAFASTSYISDVDATADMSNIHIVDGRLIVDGPYDALSVYNLSGIRIDCSSPLTKGIYIVKLAYKGKLISKKIYVA